jgi:prepilin-type N-terminal cleavage/methylation domain-containing protein
MGRKNINRGFKKLRVWQDGFSLLEVIVVLLIMGIISAVVVSRLIYDNIDLIAQTEVIKSHMRYAQSRAMNTNAVWYIRFAGESTYSLYKSGDETPEYLPGEDDTTATLPSGITVNYGASQFVSFDSWGKPCTDGNGQSPQAADRIITVACSGESGTIVVTQNTGFIP